MSILQMILGAVVGFAVGAVFYGGLRWTVLRLPEHPHPALLVGGSFLLRSGLVIAAVLLAGQGSWLGMVAVLAGMVIARLSLMPLLSRWQPRRKEAA